jgi:hypothetical protein
MRVRLIPVSPEEKARILAQKAKDLGATGPSGAAKVAAEDDAEAKRIASELKIGLGDTIARGADSLGGGLVKALGAGAQELGSLASKFKQDPGESSMMMAAKGGGEAPEARAERVTAQNAAIDKFKEFADYGARETTGVGEKMTEAGLGGVLGKTLEGFGNAAVTLPRIVAMGPGGLIIDSALVSYATANPETEVNFLGKRVKGEVLPAIIGALKGTVYHKLFGVAGQLPPGLARLGGAGTMALGDTAEQIAGGTKLKDLDVASVASSALVGGGLSGKGVPGQTMKGFGTGAKRVLTGRKPGLEIPKKPKYRVPEVDLGDPAVIARPMEKGPGLEAPVVPTAEELAAMPLRPDITEIKPVTDITQYEEAKLANAGVLRRKGASDDIRNTRGSMDILGLKDEAGNVTPHFASRAHTVLQNIIDKYSGSPEIRAQRLVEAARKIMSLPQTDLPINIVPDLWQTQRAFGTTSARTGRVSLDPGHMSGDPMDISKAVIHEVGGHLKDVFQAREGGPAMPPDMEESLGAVQSMGQVLEGVVRGRGNKARLQDLLYGANKKEFGAVATEWDRNFELFKFFMDEPTAEKAATALMNRSLDVEARPASLYQDLPVDVKLVETKEPGVYEARLTHGYDRSLGLYNAEPGTDIGAKEAELGEQLKKSLYTFSSPEAASIKDFLESAKKGIEALRNSGVQVEEGAVGILNKEYDKIWRSRETETSKKTMYPEDLDELTRRPAKAKNEDIVLKTGEGARNGWEYFAKQTPTGRTYWRKRPGEPNERATELKGLSKSAKEFYDRKLDLEIDKQGTRRFTQPRLPEMEDPELYHAVRTKDGTIFTSYGIEREVYTHPMVADHYKLTPEDVESAGWWENGEYTPKKFSSINDWKAAYYLEPNVLPPGVLADLAKMKKGGAPWIEARDEDPIARKSAQAKAKKKLELEKKLWEFAKEDAREYRRTTPAEEPVAIKMKDGSFISNDMMYRDMTAKYLKRLGIDPKDIESVGVMRNGAYVPSDAKLMDRATRRFMGHYRLFEPYVWPQKERYVQGLPEGSKPWQYRGDNWVLDPKAPEPEWFKGENFKQWSKDMEEDQFVPDWLLSKKDRAKAGAKTSDEFRPEGAKELLEERGLDLSKIAKAEKDKDGRWIQPKLPDASDPRTHLTIRMNDGTIFVDTKNEFAIHQQLAEALGVPAREVKDAGFWESGEFRPAPYSMIAEWKAWKEDNEERSPTEMDLFDATMGKVGKAGERLAQNRRDYNEYYELARDADLRERRIIYSPTKGEIERSGYEGKTALSMSFDPEVKYADLLDAVADSHKPMSARAYKPEDLDSITKGSIKKREDERPMETKPEVMARFAHTFKSAEDIIKAVGGKGRMEVRLGFDPETVRPSQVTAKLLDKIGAVKQSPEYTALFDEVYKGAKDIPWNQVAEFKTEKGSWKLADLMVVKLTNNCQRANALSFYKEFGLAPSDWSIKPCYGFSCWADRKAHAFQFNLRAKNYQSIAERGYQEASPESIAKVWQSPAFLRDAAQTKFFRHGQTGDDSHSIHRGMALEWLKNQKAAGGKLAKIPNVFISAGYAPSTPADYARLVPYKDMFVIHFSVSGWDGFPKGETLNRMNEFKMARDAGLDSVFRVITNADAIDARMSLKAEEKPPVSMKNEQWLMDSLANAFGIEGEGGKFYILETPYHNDFLPHDVARSRKGLELAQECCRPPELDPLGKGAQCRTCKVLCMTKVGKSWRSEELSIDSDSDAIGRPKTKEELLEARGKQIEEFIRRTSLTPEKAEEVRGLFAGDMTDVFGPGLTKAPAKAPKFGEKKQVVPAAPGVKFLKPEVPGAGEPGSDRWTPIAKRYGVKTVTEKQLEDSGVEFHGTPDAPGGGAGVLKGQGTLPGFPEREYASMPPPDVVKFVASVEDPKRLPGADEIETPMRLLERVGAGRDNPLKDFIYRGPKAGEDSSKTASEELQKQLYEKMEELGLKRGFAQSERIGILMTQRQHLGKAILGEMGKKPITDPTSSELELVKWIDERYLQAFHDVNAAREAAGQEPIAWREDYSTFWHVAQNLESDGISLLNAPREAIEKALSGAQEEYMRTRTPEQLAKERKRSSIFFRFAQKRSGKLGPIDLDQTNVFQKYMSSAFNQMYQAEATAAAKKLIHGQWKVNGKDYKMSQDQPYLYKQLSEYLGFITGGYKGDIPADLYRAGRAMASNAAVSKVGFNPRSVLSQLTSNVHTLTNLGKTPQYLLKAVAEDFDGVRQALMGDPAKLKFAQESGDIKWRFKDPIVDEVAKLRGRGVVMKARAGAAKVGMAGLQFFDSITADLAWRAYYAKAMDGKVEGVVRGDKWMSRTYANEEVTRTQSSASKMDLTPLQRKQWGKIATTLQNFVINEWGFVTRDVMGIRNPVMKTPERIGKVVEFYLLCAIVDSLYEDVLGIRSPMNVFGSPSTIVRGVLEEKKKGSNPRKLVGRGITETVGSLPVVGRGLQYGTDMLGVVTDPLTQAKKVGTELQKKNANAKDAAGPLVEAAGSALGVPGALPASRAAEAYSRGGSPVAAFFGGTLPPHKTAAQKKKESFAESIKRKRDELAKKEEEEGKK